MNLHAQQRNAHVFEAGNDVGHRQVGNPQERLQAQFRAGLERAVHREENRDLNQHGEAAGERIDFVLAIELHRLLLHFLRVVLVFFANRLQRLLELLHAFRGALLRHRQRPGDRLDDDRHRDDRPAPRPRVRRDQRVVNPVHHGDENLAEPVDADEAEKARELHDFVRVRENLVVRLFEGNGAELREPRVFFRADVEARVELQRTQRGKAQARVGDDGQIRAVVRVGRGNELFREHGDFADQRAHVRLREREDVREILIRRREPAERRFADFGGSGERGLRRVRADAEEAAAGNEVARADFLVVVAVEPGRVEEDVRLVAVRRREHSRRNEKIVRGNEVRARRGRNFDAGAHEIRIRRAFAFGVERNFVDAAHGFLRVGADERHRARFCRGVRRVVFQRKNHRPRFGFAAERPRRGSQRQRGNARAFIEDDRAAVFPRPRETFEFRRLDSAAERGEPQGDFFVFERPDFLFAGKNRRGRRRGNGLRGRRRRRGSALPGGRGSGSRLFGSVPRVEEHQRHGDADQQNPDNCAFFVHRFCQKG